MRGGDCPQQFRLRNFAKLRKSGREGGRRCSQGRSVVARRHWNRRLHAARRDRQVLGRVFIRQADDARFVIAENNRHFIATAWSHVDDRLIEFLGENVFEVRDVFGGESGSIFKRVRRNVTSSSFQRRSKRWDIGRDCAWYRVWNRSDAQQPW
jgi:hypothetical protein